MKHVLIMKTKLKVSYNVDKLSIIYETDSDFQTVMDTQDLLMEYITGVSSTVFIFTRTPSKIERKVPAYDVSYSTGGCAVKMGDIRCDLVGAITLDIDNAFLYSGRLNLLYDFERTYSLRFANIKYLDVCCDSNQNLPRKLNTVMHSPECEVSRRGGKKILTEKGNQRLGIKVMDNIKTLSRPERPAVSYYFYLKPSGCKRAVTLRCYNKSDEIDRVSHKTYVRDAFGYEGNIYRLEVSTFWYELTKRSKTQSGWSHEHIYRHLTDTSFLRSFFISYLNRFSTLKINNRSMRLSQILCLE